jgi:hypothetical protein
MLKLTVILAIEAAPKTKANEPAEQHDIPKKSILVLVAKSF